VAIAVSAVSVAYWIDNIRTGRQLGGLVLNQRLLAKLLTTSYNPNVACKGVPPPDNCDPGVKHNPYNIFFDPEFKALDPAIHRGVPTKPPYTGQINVVPTVQFGPSDMTWTVTRWIGADPEASSFLAGTFDPYGMHVNTYYLGLKYPVNTFRAQDPTLWWSNEYQPVSPLAKVVAYQAVSQDSGANVPVVNPDGTISYAKDPPEPVGDPGADRDRRPRRRGPGSLPDRGDPQRRGAQRAANQRCHGSGAEAHEQRRQRHAAGEPRQQGSQGLPADHDDLRDGAHQRALPRQGGGHRPLP
jgi:hypothetical protein